MKIEYKWTQCDICIKENIIESKDCIVIGNKFNICLEHIKIIKDHFDNFNRGIINKDQFNQRLKLLIKD